MSNKTMIVGGTGLLGSYTAKLISKTRHLIELRRPNSDQISAVEEIRIADLFNVESMLAPLQDVSTVLFFPGFSTPSYRPFDARHELAVTTMALANLIEAAASAKQCPHIVFSSTGGAMYGTATTPCTEEISPAPQSSYALGKLLSEEVLRFYARVGKISFTILRFSNLYGLDGARLVQQGIIDRLLDDALASRPSSIWADSSTTRDYLFVDDAAKAVEALLDAPERGHNETFNVASGVTTSIGEILSIIGDVTDGRHVHYCDPSKYGGVRHIAVDPSKFQRSYPAWNNLVPIKQGIATTWRRKLAAQSNDKDHEGN